MVDRSPRYVGRGETVMMNASRSTCGLSLTLAIMAATLLMATPYAVADGQVVVFSDTSANISSVNYATNATGTVSHVVADLDEGVYRVTQDGSQLGDYNCYDSTSTRPDGSAGDNTIEFTSTGGGTFDVVWISELSGVTPPPAPVVTTDGGNGAGADYTTTESSLLLEGTCNSSLVTVTVNGSTSGVSYTAGQTSWSYSSTLAEGTNVFGVRGIDGDGLTSPADSVTITLAVPSPPPAPVIITDGGNGAGGNYAATDPSLLLQGTCDSSLVTVEVNGSTSGVSYTAGQTSWSYSSTLAEGDNVFNVTGTNGDALTSPADSITITLVAVMPPPPPVITTDGGSGAGADYATAESSLLLEGTCDSSLVTVEVNGSPSGVSYTAGQTSWSYTDTLAEGDNAFGVTGTNGDGLTSPADTITVTLDSTAPPVPVITTDGGNGPGADFTTESPSFSLAGTCDSSTDAILVNGSSSGVAYVSGTTSWTYGEGTAETETAPIVATAFQNEGTLEADVLSSVSDQDDVWSPADIVPTWTVTADIYATGPADAAFDALSIEFPADNLNLSDLTLRVYLQKGTYTNSWEHYELLAGTFNPENEDIYGFVDQAANSRDHLPNGEIAGGTIVGWIDMPFDAVSDPSFIEPNGNIGVTLRMWNWRVDAVRLVGFSPGGTVSLSEGANTFSVTAANALGNESAADSITVTLDTTGAPPAAPVITTNGGSGPGADFTTSEPSVTLDGTCTPDSAVIRVNGSLAGVSYTAGQTEWSYAASLAAGDNTFSVTAANALGNESAADSITVTRDSTPPVSPVITTDGGSGAGANFATANALLTLEGSCAADSSVISVNGATVGVSYTAGQTTWTYAASLAEGANTFSVTAADALGNISGADSITITLDTTAPAEPVITTDGGSGPGANYLTNEPAIILQGTCSTSAAYIVVNGSGSGVTYTAGTTTWSYVSTLVEGVNTFTVVARDSLGTTSSADSITVTLDTVAPSSIRPEIRP